MAVDDTQPARRSKKKRVVEEATDTVLSQALDGVVDVTAQLMSGVSRAATTIAEAANIDRLRPGGGDFGGAGATGGWELPSISFHDISLPDISLPDIDF